MLFDVDLEIFFHLLDVFFQLGAVFIKERDAEDDVAVVFSEF